LAGVSKEGEVGKINSARVLGGGLVAALVMNIVDAAINGAVLGSAWATEGNALNPALMAKPGIEMTSMLGWVIVDLLLGIFVVWFYAAIRPRFGAGPRTAIIAALSVWFVTHLFFASYAFNQLYSASLVGASSLGSLVAILAGGLVGCWIYREPDAATIRT
jgi:hypothetical protein